MRATSRVVLPLLPRRLLLRRRDGAAVEDRRRLGRSRRARPASQPPGPPAAQLLFRRQRAPGFPAARPVLAGGTTFSWPGTAGAAITAPAESPLTAGLASPLTVSVDRSIWPLPVEATIPNCAALAARFWGASKFCTCCVRSWFCLVSAVCSAAELHQLVLGCGNRDVEDQHRNQRGRQHAEAENNEGRAALPAVRTGPETAGCAPCGPSPEARPLRPGRSGRTEGRGSWQLRCSCCSPGSDAFHCAQPG